MAKRFTNKEIVTEFLAEMTGEELKGWNERLDALMHQERITTGARYFVKNFSECFGARALDGVISKAGKAKDYLTYIGDRRSADMQGYWKDFQAHVEEVKAFIVEQETLPFEMTQMQVLQAEGKLIEEVKVNE